MRFNCELLRKHFQHSEMRAKPSGAKTQTVQVALRNAFTRVERTFLHFDVHVCGAQFQD